MRTLLMLGVIGLCGMCFGRDHDDEVVPEDPAGDAAIVQLPGGQMQRFRLIAGVAVRLERSPDDPAKMVIARNAFDLFVLDNRPHDKAWRSRWERAIESRIRSDSASHKLGVEDVRKLQAAGRGDTKRMFDRIESARREFDSHKADVDWTCRFLAETAMPMRIELGRGPAGADSLYAKMLRRIVEVPSD